MKKFTIWHCHNRRTRRRGGPWRPGVMSPGYEPRGKRGTWRFESCRLPDAEFRALKQDVGMILAFQRLHVDVGGLNVDQEKFQRVPASFDDVVGFLRFIRFIEIQGSFEVTWGIQNVFLDGVEYLKPHLKTICRLKKTFSRPDSAILTRSRIWQAHVVYARISRAPIPFFFAPVQLNCVFDPHVRFRPHTLG